MKTAIVYDRINKFGGGEQVLLTLHEIFPKAILFTSVYSKKNAKWAEVFPEVKTSFLKHIPFAENHHEFFALLMPLAFESFNFNEYDLVITVTSEAAKGIITNPNTKHICYMLTPTRYLWSGYNEYFSNKILRILFLPLINYLKNWDKVAANRPDKIIAISGVVEKRIKRYYNLDSKIIFPPVEISHNQKKHDIKEKYYLIVGRLVKYKKIDLAIKAFNELGFPLVIVGTGREEKKLKRLAHDNIHFAGFVSHEELSKYYSNALALIFPQNEDFGITAVEAESFGVPVIAYKRGGALDTVIDNKTGIFFKEQTKASLVKAVVKFGKIKFNKKLIIENAQKFSKERFKKEFLELTQEL